MRTKDKPLSKCCNKLAKLDRTALEPTWFCTGCVKSCDLIDQRAVPKRQPTGERKLMVELYKAQDGRCAISGKPLWPPEHPMFHCQGSHIMPKGTYPEWRLKEWNIIMILKLYHDLWEANKNKDALLKIEPRFGPAVAIYKEKFKEAQQNNRPWEQTPQTSNA